MHNFYWPVYKNLEKELLILADQIHFCDEQLEVHSVKIAELLLRTVVEIETLAKELYIQNGGNPKPLDVKGKERFLYFDSDCLDLLETLWIIGEKEVFISAPTFYFQKPENKILTPLKKANQSGSKSADWAKAYQAVKHDRSKNLKKANIKHLVRAMAALYLLNVYYKNEKIHFDDMKTNIGSDIFSIKTCGVFFNLETGGVDATDKECVYVCRFGEGSYKDMLQASKEDNIIRNRTLYNSTKYKDFIKNNPNTLQGKTDLLDICNIIGGKDFFIEIQSSSQELRKFFKIYAKEYVLNKNQQMYL